MTQLLELAVEAARQLSQEEQDDLARMIMGVVNGTDDEVYVLSDEENAAIDRGLAAADRGEFVTAEELATILAKYRL